MVLRTLSERACHLRAVGELNANRVSGVLIGSANTQRTRVPSDWILAHVHLTSCLILMYRANKILYTANKLAFQQTEGTVTFFNSFVPGQSNSLTKNHVNGCLRPSCFKYYTRAYATTYILSERPRKGCIFSQL